MCIVILRGNSAMNSEVNNEIGKRSLGGLAARRAPWGVRRCAAATGVAAGRPCPARNGTSANRRRLHPAESTRRPSLRGLEQHRDNSLPGARRSHRLVRAACLQHRRRGSCSSARWTHARAHHRPGLPLRPPGAYRRHPPKHPVRGGDGGSYHHRAGWHLQRAERGDMQRPTGRQAARPARCHTHGPHDATHRPAGSDLGWQPTGVEQHETARSAGGTAAATHKLKQCFCFTMRRAPLSGAAPFFLTFSSHTKLCQQQRYWLIIKNYQGPAKTAARGPKTLQLLL